jgi:hypothetical protein
MLEFIDLALGQVQRAIATATPALFEERHLDPLNSVERVFAGMAKNPPQCWVMPKNTVFADQETLVGQVHQLTVKIAIAGGDPEAVGAAAIAYTRVVDEAIREWCKWDARVMRVFIQMHDYGQLYEAKTGFVRFPDLHLMVQQQEVWQ